MFLKDTNGDDKADVRKVLFGSWNMRDTHGGASNLQYGLDNWVCAMQGYNDFAADRRRRDGTVPPGVFPLQAGRRRRLGVPPLDEQQHLGPGISEEGIVFGSTANGNPSEYMPIPNRYYEAVKGWARR